MSSRRRNDRRPLQRHGPRRDPKPRVLIVCEGTVTEPEYFRDLKRYEKLHTVEVSIVGRGEDPKSLVEYAVDEKKAAERTAKRQKDTNLAWDEVWCVFDVDDHKKLPDASQQARDNGIVLAISNPCFELWAFLHFEDQRAYVDRTTLRTKLKSLLPKYKKSLTFSSLHDSYERAVERATELDRQHDRAGTPQGNPCTQVHLLTERLRQLGKK